MRNRRLRDRFEPTCGFTLTELIVVITLMLILMAVAVPAVRSTIASTDSSNAETKLRLALQAGRDAALHSDRGADTAVVFLFEPGGRTTAVICEYAGTITDRSDPPSPGERAPERDVFVPVPTFEPVQMPANWMVRGFVPAGMMNAGGTGLRAWYDKTGAADDDAYPPGERNWLFPETGFYDARDRQDGRDRQSFMVRFVGEIGSVLLGDAREALVLDVSPTAIGRDQTPWDEFRIDAAADAGAEVRRLIARYAGGPGLFTGSDPLTDFLGDVSSDTVLCRTVEQLALYKETDLAAGIGAVVDRVTGSLYLDPESTRGAGEPKYALRADVVDRIKPWLEGDTNLDDTWLDEGDEPVARVYTVQRYTAGLRPVPLVNLREVVGRGAGGGR